MSVLVLLALFLSFTGYSSAQYCVCKPGASDPATYKKVIDYACGPQGGANCVPIQPNGPCFVQSDPVTVCSYAANSYYQNKKSVGATCDFGGICTTSNVLPTDVPSGCTFPTSAGSVSTGMGTPTTTPGTTTAGGMNPTGSSTNPNIFPTGGAGGPTGSFNDPSLSNAFSLHQIPRKLVPLTLFSGLLILWG